MKNRNCLILACTVMMGAAAPAAWADTIKLAGAKNVVTLVIGPHRAAVEKLTGHTIVVVESGTGTGLADVAGRQADVAMVAERIDIAVAVAEASGRKIHPSALRMHELLREDVVFVVNASNPVSKLSLAQLSDIHTGKITNWKQVGGRDQAITVYADELGGGTRALVRKVVLRGEDYAPGVKTLVSASRIADMVPTDDSGIGALSRGLIRVGGATKVIETTRISSPLSLVTVGEPSAGVSEVITAFQRAAAGALYARAPAGILPVGPSD